MIKYNSYKDSEIYWLGQIPYVWTIKRVKDLFKSFGSGTTPNTSLNQYYDVQQVNWLTTGDIQNSIINSTKFKISEQAVIDYRLKLFPSNSIAIGMYGQGKTRGSVGYLNIPATSNQNAGIMYGPKGCEPKYVFWWFIGNYEAVRQLGNVSAIPNLNGDLVKNIPITCPSLKEQTAIAEYLDTKTQAIDKKVSLLEKKIGYYQELRKSLINETVTKGLDKNVKLKDSGIDWIGQIPEHWEVRRLKNIGNIETSSVNKKIEEDEKLVKLVNYVDIYNNPSKEIWNSEDFMTVSANELQVRSKRLKKGDALFTPSSETIEDIGVSSIVMENLENTLYSYHLIRLRFTYDFAIHFKKYMLNNNKVQYYFSHSATGTTRKILGLNTFYNLPIVFPPSKKEQAKIGQFLKDKTTKIDQIIINIQTQLSTLKALRKTLINDVVTGKIKVIKD